MNSRIFFTVACAVCAVFVSVSLICVGVILCEINNIYDDVMGELY
ncbi:unnamed protein product, partial [Nippostrongylus brasiliensis]|uniref:Col_cuticle_N domain-containing protein n=1 Tax=Nippostrongylus brasiliensis TaxID=27835 RepID=A0A0N4XNP6_NIPBR